MSFNREVVKGQEVHATEFHLTGAAIVPALAAAATLAADAPSLQILTPTATRVITMPAEADVEGKVWFFVNKAAGAFALTINDAAETPNLIISCGQNESVMIGVYGGAWHILMQGASA